MDAAELAAVQARLDASLPYDEEASTITIVVGLSGPEVLAAFGGDPAEEPIPLKDAWEEAAPTLLLVERPGAVFAVEFNGYQGSRGEVLRRASARGRAGSVYWNVNMLTALSLAEAGDVLFQEEIYDDLEAGDPVLEPYFADLDFASDTWRASALTVVERFTGVRVDGTPTEGPLLVHRLHPHLRDRVAQEPGPADAEDPYRYYPQTSSLAEDFGAVGAAQLTEAVKRAPVAVRRGIAAYAVRRALRAAGMEHEADLAETVARLDHEPALTHEAELMIRRGTHVGYNVPTPASACALHAVETAVSGDSTAAALNALRWAAAAIDAAGQAPDCGVGRRLYDWEWRKLPTPRGAYRVTGDLRAFLEDVFARLDLTPEPGALPTVPEAPAEAAGGPWTPIAPWPFVAWDVAVTAWVGTEAVVFGASSDGRHGTRRMPSKTGYAAGAYDPKLDRWRPIAEPPCRWRHGHAAVCGRTVYLLAHVELTEHQTRAELWAYAVASDTWRQVLLPPGEHTYATLLAAGRTLVLARLGADSLIWLHDPISEQWRAAPPGPWEASELRQVLGLPDGRVVRMDLPARDLDHLFRDAVGGVAFAGEFVDAVVVMGGGDEEEQDEEEFDPDFDGDTDDDEPDTDASPTWLAAVLDPGASAWREMPPAPVVMDGWDEDRWSVVTNSRVVCPSRGTSTALAPDGSSGTVRLPRGGVLDVDAGRWEKLPDLPGLDRGDPIVGEDLGVGMGGSGGAIALRDGWAYDAQRRVWIELPGIPDRPVGVAAPAAVWAGEHLLLFAHAVVEPLDDEEFDTRLVASAEAWAWRPTEAGPTADGRMSGLGDMSQGLPAT